LGHEATLAAPFHVVRGDRHARRSIRRCEPALGRAQKSDARCDMCALESRVREIRPTLPERADFLTPTRQTELVALCSAQLEARLATETFGGDFPCRCEQMGVEVARVSSRRMDRNIHRTAVAIRYFLSESRRELRARRRPELVGKCHDELAGDP